MVLPLMLWNNRHLERSQSEVERSITNSTLCNHCCYRSFDYISFCCTKEILLKMTTILNYNFHINKGRTNIIKYTQGIIELLLKKRTQLNIEPFKIQCVYVI